MSSFLAKQKDVTTKYEMDQKDGRPIKLGDGSFGVVLKVTDPKGLPGAVKLYYEHVDAGVTMRNDEEMRLRNEISKIEEETGVVFEKSGLVLPDAVVDDFLNSDAYKKYKDFFHASGLRLTGKGIVMEYFDCTLKELLERGAPEGRYCAGRHAQKMGSPGYDILRAAEPDERERCILPILRQLALALQALHGYGLHHHDLKPANILLKSEGGSIRAALGDFGFADPNRAENTRIVKIKDEAMAEGTRHYRSVEQKDNVDVCEVDVEVKENPDDTVTLVLVTRDAKFFDSIIEPDDICVFRKDSSRRPWFVEKIVRDQRDPQSLTTIVLRAEKAKDNNNKKIQVASDKRTQVAFLKQQTHRTDLFGFGAIAFDLITAGRSPERFYDLLRPLDKLQDNEHPFQVNSIRAAYAAFAAAPSAEPTHRALFNELRVGTTFPGHVFVGIILKCMLSKPFDSYFGGDILPRPRTVTDCFRDLLDEVSKLTEQIATKHLADNYNPLWLEKEGPTPPPPPRLPGFGEVLRAHRKSLLQDSPAIALARAYKLLTQITTTVEEALIHHEEGAERGLFFSLLSPDHLNGDAKLDAQSAAYPTEQSYNDALQSGENVSFGSSIDANSFLPPHMRYRIRQVALTPLSPSDSNADEGIQYRYAYRDSSPCWPGVEKGDIARLWNEQRTVTLFHIDLVSKEVVSLKPVAAAPKATAAEALSMRIDRAEFVKQIRASDYYFGVLAIYIHQLFFHEGGEGFGSLSAKMWWLEQADNLGFLDRNKMDGACFPKKETSVSTTEAVQIKAAALYVWLLLRGYEITTHQGVAQGPALRGLIKSKIQSLGEIIARSLGEDLPWLEAVVRGGADALVANINEKQRNLEKLAPSLESFLDKLAFGEWITVSPKKGRWLQVFH